MKFSERTKAMNFKAFEELRVREPRLTDGEQQLLDNWREWEDKHVTRELINELVKRAGLRPGERSALENELRQKVWKEYEASSKRADGRIV